MHPFFLINPNSSAVRKRGSVLEQVGTDHDIDLVKTQSLSDLTEVFKFGAERGVDWFCLEGGDGTVQTALSAYQTVADQFETPPKFTLLPGGMTNQVSRHIGIRRPVKKRLAEVISGKEPETVNMPMLRIEMENDCITYGFLFSTGALPMATSYYFDRVHKDGKGGAGAVTQMIAKGFAGSRSVKDQIYRASPLSLRVTGDKEEIHLDNDHLTTVVTTLPGLMLGLDPFWGDGTGDLRLTYVREDAQHILRHLISLWAGRKNVSRSDDGIESFKANVLRYIYNGPVILDGERLKQAGSRLELRATDPIEFWR